MYNIHKHVNYYLEVNGIDIIHLLFVFTLVMIFTHVVEQREEENTQAANR